MARDFTSLLRRQVLLVTGKGGVGKSTVAAAFAALASRRKARTLFLELDSDASLESIFGVPGVGHAPRRIHEDLWAARVDVQEQLGSFIRENVPAGPLVKAAVTGRIMGRFWRATPSAAEMLSLIRLLELADEAGQDGERRWTNLVVDLPSTGHALSTLEVARTATHLFKVGPVRAGAEGVRSLLGNHLRTAMVWVTIPEDMPVNETLEFFPRFRERLDVSLEHVIVNGVHPEILAPVEHAAFDALRSAVEPGSSGLYGLVKRVEGMIEAGQRDRSQIGRLRGSLDAAFLEIPQIAARGSELVSMVADILEGSPSRESGAESA